MKTLLATVRWKQWIKNGLVFAPWFASGSGLLSSLDELMLGFISFSLLSSAIYIFNDIRDVEEDRRHPTKSKRPIAAGLISPAKALILGIFLFLISVVMTQFLLSSQAIFFLLTYFVTSVLYVLVMRNIFLLDLFFLSSGFVLRVLFGGAVSDTPISAWLLVVIGGFALFVATGKRFSEVQSGNAVLTQRKTLHQYTPEYLQVLLVTSLTSVIVAYALWTIEGAANTSLAILSLVPFAFILLRYLQSIMGGKAEAPEQVLFQDRTLIAGAVVWIAIFYLRFV